MEGGGSEKCLNVDTALFLIVRQNLRCSARRHGVGDGRCPGPDTPVAASADEPHRFWQLDPGEFPLHKLLWVPFRQFVIPSGGAWARI